MSFPGKSVGFAAKAEVISATSGGSGWCSIQELSENNIAFASASRERYLHQGNCSAIDAILDAQDLMDEVGVTDANAQASILAAVSSRFSANPRRNAQFIAKVHALELRMAEHNNASFPSGTGIRRFGAMSASAHTHEMPFGMKNEEDAMLTQI